MEGMHLYDASASVAVLLVVLGTQHFVTNNPHHNPILLIDNNRSKNDLIDHFLSNLPIENFRLAATERVLPSDRGQPTFGK